MIDRGAVALDNIASLAENLDAVVEDFQQATGGRQLAGSVAAISEMIDQIQNGGGLLHSLIYDEYEGDGIESVEHSLEIFENILQEIETGEGVLHSLIYEPLDEQSVVNEAFEAGSKLNNILAKIDEGEGTIGLLINDPTLYEDMKILVNGAQRSAVVRTMIRLSSEEEQ